jgi:hypothetical protein
MLAANAIVRTGRLMSEKCTVWVHEASFTFRLDEPRRILETIWSERPGWGYIRRKDLWVPRECSIEELRRAGYVLRKPVAEDGAQVCPHCNMYIVGIPGHLVKKHVAECGGGGEDWKKLEDTLMENIRLRLHEARILAEKVRIERELEEAEKKERFERVKEEMLARQRDKDRKARLRRETREELRRR